MSGAKGPPLASSLAAAWDAARCLSMQPASPPPWNQPQSLAEVDSSHLPQSPDPVRHVSDVVRARRARGAQECG